MTSAPAVWRALDELRPTVLKVNEVVRTRGQMCLFTPSPPARAVVALDLDAQLDAVYPSLPTVLVNPFPLVRDPTRLQHYPEFAQWFGIDAAVDRHVRLRAAATIYGELHTPRTAAAVSRITRSHAAISEVSAPLHLEACTESCARPPRRCSHDWLG